MYTLSRYVFITFVISFSSYLLGLYLSDLVFLAELPTFIKANADTNNEDYIEHDKKLYERLCHPLVNYNKFRITGK